MHVCVRTYIRTYVYMPLKGSTLCAVHRMENAAFKDFCSMKEKSKSCQGLGLISFLLLPMQRITRMPLLILAILNRMALDDPERDLVEKTLKSVQEVGECACHCYHESKCRSIETHLWCIYTYCTYLCTDVHLEA